MATYSPYSAQLAICDDLRPPSEPDPNAQPLHAASTTDCLCFYHKRLMLCGMDDAVRSYLAKIGRTGGKKSRRALDPETARSMVRVREARRAYRTYRTQCFWSYAPDLKIGADDVTWVAENLMKHGNRGAWRIGRSLCP